MYERDQLFIDGKWDAPDSDSVITVVSPHSEAVIGHAASAGPADVNRAVEAARAAFDTGPWPRMQPAERIEAQTRLGGRYKERRADMAALISAEIGAPISFAKMAQVRLPLMMMSAFSGLAGNYQWQQDRPGLYGKDIRISKQPVGVVAAVVPWNMPQFLTVAKVIPALLAGCSVVLKPAPESVLDAQLLADLVAEADLPPGVLNVVPGGRDVGELLAGPPGAPRRRRGTQAGQPRTGRQVGRHRARRCRPVGRRYRNSDGQPGQQRPGLQRAEPNPGAVSPQGRVRRRVGGGDGVDDGRRPRRCQHPDRPAGGKATAGTGPRLHRIGPERRGAPGDRRRRPARRSGHWLGRAAGAGQRPGERH